MVVNTTNLPWEKNHNIAFPHSLVMYYLLFCIPLPQGSSTKFEFDNMIVGQAIPSNFIPAIEKGFKEAANSWVASCYYNIAWVFQSIMVVLAFYFFWFL